MVDRSRKSDRFHFTEYFRDQVGSNLRLELIKASINLTIVTVPIRNKR